MNHLYILGKYVNMMRGSHVIITLSTLYLTIATLPINIPLQEDDFLITLD